MAIKAYLDTAGTVEVAGDGVGPTLYDVDSVASFWLKADEGTQNAEAVTIPAPPDCQVSKSADTGYASSIVFAIGEIKDEYARVYIKRNDDVYAAGLSTGIPPSPRLNLIATEDIPEAPLAFTPTVSNVTSGGCRVSFGTTDPDGDSLTYKVAVTTSATPPSDWSSYTDRTSPHDVTGLDPETTYYAHVRATDGTFVVVGTSASFETIAVDAISPVLTGTLTAIPSGGQVSLDWSDATDNVGVVGYDVEYGPTTDYGSAVSPDPTVSNATITGLTGGTLYYFRVRARDAAGNVSGWLTASAAPVTYLATFDGSAGAAPDTSYFTVELGGSGDVELDGSGNLKILAPTVPDAGLCYKTAAVDLSVAHEFGLRFAISSATTLSALWLLSLSDAVAKRPTGDTTVGPANYYYGRKSAVIPLGELRLTASLSYATGNYFLGNPLADKISSDDTLRWDGAAWATAGSSNVTAATDTYYWYVINTDPTLGFKAKYLSADKSTILNETSWLPWSEIEVFSNSAWLFFGVPWTSSHTGQILVSDFYEV